MNNDEVIRLVLETTGSASLDEAVRKLREIKDAGKELENTYEVLERQVGEYAVIEEKTTEFILQGVRHRTQAESALLSILDETTDAVKRGSAAAAEMGHTAGAGGGFGRGMLQGSYAVQDFTSQLGTRGLAGALGAIQNNIPGILQSFGGGAGLAGVISVVAVGAGLAYENWDKLSGMFTKTQDKLPELKEGLDGLKDSLKEIDDEIEKIEKQAKEGGLNLFDEEKLKKLRRLKTEGETQQADLKMVGSVGELDSKEARAIAASVKAAVAESGGGAAVAQNLAMNMGLSGTEATAAVAGAMRGNLTDLQSLQAGAPTFAGRYSTMSPEALKAKKEADKALKEEQAEAKRRDKEDERAADREIDNALESQVQAARQAEQQRRTQNSVVRQTEAEAARAADKAARDREKQARENTPEAQLRRQAADDQSRVAAEAMRQWKAGGQQETADQLQGIIRDAVNRLPAAGGNISAALQQAVQAGYMKSMQNQQREAMRLQQFSESFYQP